MRFHTNLLKLSFFLALMFCTNAMACELHGKYGFASHLQGSFTNGLSNTQSSEPNSSRQWLSLTTKPMQFASVSSRTEIRIEYQRLQQFDNLNFTLEASPDIEAFDFAQTEHNSESGLYTFTVIPTEVGIIKLVIAAIANKGDEVKTLRKMLYINSIGNPD